ESGLAKAARGGIRLCLVSTASMASGIPWPRISGDHNASSDTTRPPATATSTRFGPRCSRENGGSVQARWWNRATLVMPAMRWMSTQAAPPPRATASALTRPAGRTWRRVAVVLTDEQFARILEFRVALRRFGRFTEEQAGKFDMTAAQYQLLLAVRGHEHPIG